MEPQAPLIGADGAVELDPVAVGGVGVAPVIHPGHQEGEHLLRLYHAGEEVQLLIPGVGQRRVDHLEPGLHGLEVLRLVGVAFFEVR